MPSRVEHVADPAPAMRARATPARPDAFWRLRKAAYSTEVHCLPAVALSLFHSARFVTSAAELTALAPPGLPEIAFAGRSNAGKSTVINELTQQKRLAFASKTPGRTQLLNFFALSEKNEHGERVERGYLVDLPGYGYARADAGQRATWDELVGGYVRERQSLIGIVLVMDARRPFMPGDDALSAIHRPSRLLAALPAEQIGPAGHGRKTRRARGCPATRCGHRRACQRAALFRAQA